MTKSPQRTLSQISTCKNIFPAVTDFKVSWLGKTYVHEM